VKELVEKFAEIWGVEKDIWSKDKSPQPSETELLLLDSTKSRTELGWIDRLSFSETVSLTVNWYKQAQNSDIRKNSMRQLDDFLSLET
jgi:nucleoside-diphosphate-sugar epimerase